MRWLDGWVRERKMKRHTHTHTHTQNNNNVIGDDDDDDAADDGDKTSPPCELQYTVRDFMSVSADAFSSPWIRIVICCLCCFVLCYGQCCYHSFCYSFDVNISIKTIIRWSEKKEKREKKKISFSRLYFCAGNFCVRACVADWITYISRTIVFVCKSCACMCHFHIQLMHVE